MSDNFCQNLINLYKDLIENKNRFYFEFEDSLKMKNIKTLKNTIDKIKNNIDNINIYKIINPAILDRFEEDMKPRILEQIGFYKDIFNIDISDEIKNLEIPEKRENYDEFLIITPKITYTLIREKFINIFGNENFNDNNTEDIFNEKSKGYTDTSAIDRASSNRIYSVFIQNPDNSELSETYGKTQINLAKNKIEAINIKESLINYLQYFLKNNKKLYDGDFILACAGSIQGNIYSPSISVMDGRLYLLNVQPNMPLDTYLITRLVVSSIK